MYIHIYTHIYIYMYVYIQKKRCSSERVFLPEGATSYYSLFLQKYLFLLKKELTFSDFTEMKQRTITTSQKPQSAIPL